MAGLQADTTLRTMLSLLLPHLRLDSLAIKLQVNKGGLQCSVLLTHESEVDSRGRASMGMQIC